MSVRKYFPANPMPSESVMLAGYQEINAILGTTRVVLFSLTLSRDRLLHLSPSASELYGETVDVLIHHPGFWMEAIHPADQAMVWQAFDQFIRHRQNEVMLRYRLCASDGEEIAVTHHAVMVHAANGQRLRIDCAVTPASPQPPLAVPEATPWFHVAPIPLLVLHRQDERVSRANAAAARLLGEPTERLVGRMWSECFVAEPSSASAVQASMSGREPAVRTGHVFTANGERRRVEMRCSPVSSSNADLLLVSLQDIEAPSALDLRYRRAQAMFERAQDVVVHADAAGQLESVNPHGCMLVGLSEDTIQQRFLIDLFPTWAQPHFLHTCLPLATRDGLWRGELALAGREGRHVPVMLTLIAHKPQGVIEGYSLWAHDVSPYKLREQRFKAAKEALEADRLLRDSLLDNVSRSLVSPMRRLRELVSVLEREPRCLNELLPQLRQQVQQAGQLVDATTEFLAHGAQRELPPR